MESLPRVPARGVSTEFGTLDLRQHPVQTVNRAIVQVGKETVLEIEIVVRQRCQPSGVDKESGYDEDGLVVWCGWVAKCPQIPGFIDEAQLQNGAPKSYGHRWWP